MASWHEPFTRALRAGAYIVAHTTVALLLIVAIFVVQWALVRAGDPKLFDWIPLRYLFDAMDVGILLAFICLGTVEAIIVFREHHDP